MTQKEASINLKIDDYKQEGIYLHFEDSSSLVLTNEVIAQAVNDFWSDSAKIPPEIKRSDEFQRCSVCPGREQEGFCAGLGPVLPFLEIIDKYKSFDPVIAIYKGKGLDVLSVANTTMQHALTYVSNLSLLNHCLYSRGYWRYYFRVEPLLSSEAVVAKIYLNIYWLHGGNREKIDDVISRFQEEMMLTTKNQVGRLGLICKNDAFINAFINAQVATALLSSDFDSILNLQIENYNK